MKLNQVAAIISIVVVLIALYEFVLKPKPSLSDIQTQEEINLLKWQEEEQKRINQAKMKAMVKDAGNQIFTKWVNPKDPFKREKRQKKLTKFASSKIGKLIFGK